MLLSPIVLVQAAFGARSKIELSILLYEACGNIPFRGIILNIITSHFSRIKQINEPLQ